jgi:uncharacterized protein
LPPRERSSFSIAEFAEVLEHEHIRRRFERKRRSVHEALASYESLVDSILPASITPSSPDPDDDMVLACALAASADLIVSGDKGLRNLKSFHRIPILGPAEAFVRIRKSSASN